MDFLPLSQERFLISFLFTNHSPSQFTKDVGSLLWWRFVGMINRTVNFTPRGVRVVSLLGLQW